MRLLVRHVLGAVILCAAGAFAVLALAPELQLPAQLGIGLSGAAGILALLLDARAQRQRLTRALGVTVVSMFVRLGLWVASAGLTGWRGDRLMAFTLGFFGVYAVLLFLEIKYLVSAARTACTEVTE